MLDKDAVENDAYDFARELIIQYRYFEGDIEKDEFNVPVVRAINRFIRDHLPDPDVVGWITDDSQLLTDIIRNILAQELRRACVEYHNHDGSDYLCERRTGATERFKEPVDYMPLVGLLIHAIQLTYDQKEKNLIERNMKIIATNANTLFHDEHPRVFFIYKYRWPLLFVFGIFLLMLLK